MNMKTLLVLCCILAVAQARPTAVASPTSCSVSCNGRNFWTGYTSGTTLQYTFQQSVELKSNLTQQKSVIMQVTGQANVEVHSDCEMVLTVDVQATKSSKSPSEADTLEAKTLPKAMVDALKQPLRFAFEDGRIGAMCPSSGETRASLNFKRGLLSQLHMSIDVPDQEVAIHEEDVLGDCWTVYKPLGGNRMEKTKDLSSCSNNFEVFPRQGVKYEAPKSNNKWPTVVQGSLKCTVELESESKVIKENLCVEDRTLDNDLGESGRGENVKVTTSLRLKQQVSSLASTLFEVSDRSDMKHRHKTGDRCHDSKVWFEEDVFHSGNECLEKKLPSSGTASSDFKILAKQTLESLCTETRGMEMLNSTALKFADVIKYMRGITTQEDFNSLFDWVKNGYCRDNDMFTVLFYSAIPSVGTKYSVKVIVDQLKESGDMSMDPKTANWMVNGLAMMPHPTPEMITEILGYARKSKEDAMLMVSKGPALALSAVTGRYCNINTECQTNDAVAEVLSFFTNSLGTNCSNLENSDDPVTFDYAFISLLSIGNIGRATGGAAPILGCAENTRLSLVNRAFAVRALRRFPDLSKKQLMRLGKLVMNKTLDAELRITAYQAMTRYADTSFWSNEMVVNKLSELMQDPREDQHVQGYVYTYLKQWMREQTRVTDSYTVSAILRDYARKDSRMSGMQVSAYYRKAFKNPSYKTKTEMESNVIYSSKSVLPRFVNLNFTVESPLTGESINVFEFGVRMEGLESMMEQVFNILSADDQQLVRKRRQASPELTDEQKQYQQQPVKQRLDFFTRKNGMELMHNNFDETILSFIPTFLKTLDVENVKGLFFEKMSNFNMEKQSQAAETMVESTISMPTISGFPILVKKETHYLTNIRFKQEFSMPSSKCSMGLEVQPTASIHMARTVTVDSGFERAGVRSRTSGLTSMGVKLSLEADFSNWNDILFSYKVDPLKKRQKVLELTTDVKFIQHNGPSNLIESPVVSPSDMTPVTSTCFTPATVKLLGRSLCLETHFERTYNPVGYVRQNPGSFRLFVDKDDSLGVYEATLRFKKEGRNVNLTAVLGDQNSPDRHAKFQFAVTRSSGTRKIVVELANPVLPLKWESESKANGAAFDVSVDMKFGTTDYKFRGTRARDEDGSWK